MNLSAPFINRPIMTTLLMVGILFFGILAYNWLPISDLPSYDAPTIEVSAQNPGADAETMAATVATPLEKEMMTIPGLRSVRSTSSSGSTRISLEFDLNRNVDAASTDVAAAINRAAGVLPPEMPSPPQYSRFNPANTPVMYIAVSSETMTMGSLYDYANSVVAQRLSMIDGVSRVEVYGAKKAVRIKLNPDILAAFGIGVDEVSAAVVAANQSLPGGAVYDNYQALTLQPKGQLVNASQYQRLIVTYRNGAPVRIEDIGHAVDSTELENLFISFWSAELGQKPTIVLAVNKQAGFNTVKLVETILGIIPKLQDEIPDSVNVSVISESATGIKESIWEVKFTLLVAFVLVVLVIFLFLGNISSTIIPSIALPLSIIGTFGLMYYNNFSIDILSMLALTLVVGFLVDDAIVVLENIVRHAEMGKSPLQASLDGSRQISTTVLAMTMSLAAVFIPLVFMPGIMGKMFHEFAVVVVAAVVFSGFISLTLTPMLCSRFLSVDQRKTRLELLASWLIQKSLNYYEPMLRWCIRHRSIPVLASIIALVTGLYLFNTIPQDFLPPGDTGSIQGFSIASQGVSPAAMKEYETEVTTIIKQNPAVKAVIVGANIPGFLSPNQGFAFIMLKDKEHRPPINAVVGQLYGQLGSIPGLMTFLKPFPQINLDVGTKQSRAQFSYYLSSIEDPNELYRLTEELTAQLQKLPQLRDVSSDVQVHNPQLTVEILRDQATSYGISAEKIEQALMLGYGGALVSTFSTPLDTYRVFMEMEAPYRADAASLSKIYLTSRGITSKTDLTSSLVPLESVAKWTPSVGPMEVNHVNQFTSTTISFNLAPQVALGTAIQKVEEAAAQLLPPSISTGFAGEAEAFQGTTAALAILMLVGIAAIYLMLGSLYESFIHPLTILSALPGALFGALLTLIIFQASLSIYAYVGIIVLIGIVMKNGIMLVEFANELVHEGRSAAEAIVEACKVRFRPILMTTVAAAMGAVPIVLGIGSDASARRPLGLVIVGGLIFAQLITYFFTPIAYLWLEEVQEWFQRKKD